MTPSIMKAFAILAGLLPAATQAADQELTLTAEQAASLALETASVVRREIAARLSLPGRLEEDQRRSFRVGPVVAAIIESIVAVEHDRVEQGHILARLRSDALGQAQADYLDAHALYTLAQAEHTRLEGLWQDGIVAESRWLQADSNYKRAAAALDQQQRRLKLAGLSEKQIKALDDQPDRLATFNLVSPVDGVVLEGTVVSGQALAAGETAFRVADLSSLWAVLRIPVANIGDVTIGAAASILLSARPNQPAEGRLASLGGDVDVPSQTVEGRVIVDNPDGLLRPGMYAQVALTGLPRQELAVPAAAVFRLGDQAYVFTVLSPRRFAPVAVDIGEEAEGWVPLRAGIEEGAEVVVEGVAALKGHWQYQEGE